MTLKQLISAVKNSPDRRAELIRFGLVGGIATALQYAFYLLFCNALALSAVLSAILSYLLSFLANFALSSLFTFKSKPNRKKAASFLASHMINLGLQTALVAIFQGLVGKSLAMLPAMAICIPTNYFLVRFSFKSKYVAN